MIVHSRNHFYEKVDATMKNVVVSGLSVGVPNAEYDRAETQLNAVRQRIRTLNESGAQLSQIPSWNGHIPQPPALAPPPIPIDYHWRNIVSEKLARIWIAYANRLAEKYPDQKIEWARFIVDGPYTTTAAQQDMLIAIQLLSAMLDRVTTKNAEKSALWREITNRYLYANTGNPILSVTPDRNADMQTLAVIRAAIGDDHDTDRIRVTAAGPPQNINEWQQLRGLLARYEDPVTGPRYKTEDEQRAWWFKPGVSQPLVRNPNTLAWHLDAIPYAENMYDVALRISVDPIQLRPMSDAMREKLQEFISGPYKHRDSILRFYYEQQQAQLNTIVDSSSPAARYLQLIAADADARNLQVLASVFANVAFLQLLPANLTREKYALEVASNANFPDQYKQWIYKIEKTRNGEYNVPIALMLRMLTMPDAPVDPTLSASTVAWLRYCLKRNNNAPEFKSGAIHPELYLRESIDARIDAWVDAALRPDARTAIAEYDEWFYHWGDRYLLQANHPPVYRTQLELRAAESELASLLPMVQVDKTVRLASSVPIDEHVVIDGVADGDAVAIEWYFVDALTSTLTRLPNQTSSRLYLPNHTSGDYFCIVNGVQSTHTLHVTSLQLCVRCGRLTEDYGFDIFGACKWFPNNPPEIAQTYELARRAQYMIDYVPTIEWYKDKTFGYTDLVRMWSQRFLTLPFNDRARLTKNTNIIDNGIAEDATPFVDAWALLSDAKIQFVLDLDASSRDFIKHIKDTLACDIGPDWQAQLSPSVTVPSIVRKTGTNAFCNIGDMQRVIRQSAEYKLAFPKIKWRGYHSTENHYPLPYDSIDSQWRGDVPDDADCPFDALAGAIANQTGVFTGAQREEFLNIYNEWIQYVKSSPVAPVETIDQMQRLYPNITQLKRTIVT